MFVRKIFEKKADESVHQQFVRFGKGIFTMKAVVNAKISGKSVKASGTFELANDFVLLCCELAPKLNVSGIILSKERLGLENERKKSGTFEYKIEREIGSEELKGIVEKCYFALVDCGAPGISFRIKKKLPRPGKSGEAKINDKFCALETDLKHFQKFKGDFFWDIPDFKRARAEHSYIITEIIAPKGETDFAKIRLDAKRKGKISRKTIFDGKEMVKEVDFAA